MMRPHPCLRIGVTAARVTVAGASNSLDVVWQPWFTPSRTPLLNQRWVVVPPLHSPEESVKEIKWGKDNGAVGVFFRGIEGERTLDDPYFHPVYQAANDTGLFNHRGIQAINYGSRDIRFQHTDHDLVALNNVFNAAKVFAFLGIHR